jgi:hypothetical protein
VCYNGRVWLLTCVACVVAQFFALGAESWYAMIAVDLLANLVLSPFGTPDKRIKWYHLYVCVTGGLTSLLLMDPTTGNDNRSYSFGPAGSADPPGTYLIMHVCWQKKFGLRQGNGNFWSGWTFFYGPAVAYYSFAFGVMLYSWYVLRRGISQTYKVRQRQMKVGQKLVGVLTLYLMGLFVVFNKNMRRSQDGRGWLTVLMAAWIGARGICDALVWAFVLVPFAAERDGRPIHSWWRCGGRGGDGHLRQPLMRSSVGSISSPGQRQLSGGDGGGAAEGEGGAPEGVESEEREGEELNIALRDEVLYFTLLGLRNAASGRHMSGACCPTRCMRRCSPGASLSSPWLARGPS